ncbi:MAG: DUF4835 family protein [Bacteroidales bacterium]|nr:DUF4835 family protein [Bacteroidales bacterium]
MKYIKSFLLILLCTAFKLSAQELDASVEINSQKVQGVESNLFPTMKEALTSYINERKWTEATFSPAERIACSFTITVNEAADNSFKGEIQIQARRPVYNSAYTTTLLNHRDVNFDFEYLQGQTLEWNDNTLDNNLLAVITYYIYLIIGIDFDSFAPLGGTPYFQQAMNITNMAQAQSTWTGWAAFQDANNRHAIITAHLDERLKNYREMWYTYHRKGLDEMAANPDRGRMTILAAVKSLEEVRSSQPTTCLLTLFSTAKLDEVVNVYSKANTQEKQDGYKFLSNLYPAETTRLEPMKK